MCSQSSSSVVGGVICIFCPSSFRQFTHAETPGTPPEAPTHKPNACCLSSHEVVGATEAAEAAAEAAVAAVADLFEFGGMTHGWVEVGSAKRQ